MTVFDPYCEWLGIPPEEQPPNHYRLLGIPPFTADAGVIESAAARRMAELRAVQSGEHGSEAKQVLHHVTTSKACLLDAEQRAAYDLSLRSQPEFQQARQRPAPRTRLSDQPHASNQPLPAAQTVVEAQTVHTPTFPEQRKRTRPSRTPSVMPILVTTFVVATSYCQ